MMGMRLHRTQLLLDPAQHKLLARLARQQKRSLSDVAREALALGLQALTGSTEAHWTQRTIALGRADRLRQAMRQRRGRPLQVDIASLINETREERNAAIVRAGRRD
jgi:hypothetical protein